MTEQMTGYEDGGRKMGNAYFNYMNLHYGITKLGWVLKICLLTFFIIFHIAPSQK